MLYTFIILVCLGGCRKEVDIKSYLNYISKEESGLLKTKKINGIEIKMRYMPCEYLAYRDMETFGLNKEKSYDSLLGLYKNNLSFILTIGPDEQEKVKGDIMLKDIGSMEDFKMRVSQMNFNMEELISLTVDNEKTAPSLTSLENIYGLKNSRNIIIVFPSTAWNFEKTEAAVVSYDDQLFETGINNFEFKKEDILNIPRLKWSPLEL